MGDRPDGLLGVAHQRVDGDLCGGAGDQQGGHRAALASGPLVEER